MAEKLTERGVQMTVEMQKAKNVELAAQLAAETRRREEAVEALEKSRAANRKKRPALPKAPKLKGDVVEVTTGDWHGNKIDPAGFAAFLADLKMIQPDRLILGGDILDCGGVLAEHHTLGYVAESADSYEDDVATANGLLDQVQGCASEIHYLEGNHEWRVERWALGQKLSHAKDIELLRRTFAAEHVLGLADRAIRYYRSGETHGDSHVPGWVRFDDVWFVHRLSRSANSARAAVQSAAANVVYFDTHRADYLPVRKIGTGHIAAWNPGCLCRFQPLYCQTRPTEWTHGYLVRWISRTGKFLMINVPIIDGVSLGSSIFSK